MQAVPIINTAIPAGEDWVPLFREQYPSLVRLAARILGSRLEAEDIAAEAFVKLVREGSAVRNRAGWLKQCTLYLALDKLRSNQRRTNRERWVPVAREPESPETELLILEEQARVRLVLSELSQRDAVLLLGRADGNSYRELAELAGIRPASTGAMLVKAEKRFKEKYEHHYGTR